MALILVVDDEQDACSMLDRMLSAMGHTVVSFTDGFEALEWLDHHMPHLVILDFKLQRMDGIQLLKLVRERYPEMGILMLTAYPSVQVAAEAIRWGAARYLSKPIEIDQLEACVEEVLSSRG